VQRGFGLEPDDLVERRDIPAADLRVQPLYPSQEVHFAAVGGTGGFAEPCRFFKSLRVPVAVIADLDAISEPDKLAETLEVLAGDPNLAGPCVALVKKVADQVKSLPPPITEDQAHEELKALAEEGPRNWPRGDDNVLRGKLNKIVKRLKRIGRLKEGGMSAYVDHQTIHENLRALIEECSKIGLFLVPVGELEDWIPHLMAADWPRDKGPKSERATVTAERIRRAQVKDGDVWAFTESVLKYLKQQL
jgi:hypothetical protein